MTDKPPMDLFDLSKLPKGQELHPKVTLLIQTAPERAVLEEWSQEFIDRDGKFVSQFQVTFHSCFLELFIFAMLKSMHMDVDLSHPTPDFLVTSPVPIVIEAVSAGIRKNGRPEADRGLDDILTMLKPPWMNPDFKVQMAEAVVRYSNAIWEKKKKYHGTYASLSWVTTTMPYVIALGSFAQVNYGSEFDYSITALLYGFVFDVKTMTRNRQGSVTKPGTTSLIELNLFARDDFRHVSAVVFTCTLTLGKLSGLSISRGMPTFQMVYHILEDFDAPPFKVREVSPETPEDLFTGVFVLHNPRANNPLPDSTFAGTEAIQIWDRGQSGLEYRGQNLPLVARFNTSRALITRELMREWMIGVMIEFNAPSMFV
jgi:hypothetical protein